MSELTFRDANSSGIRRALRRCRKTPCECLLDFIENAIYGEHHGLLHRFARMWASDAVSSQIENHATQINDQKRGLQEARDLWERFCRNGNGKPNLISEADEWLAQIPPTKEQWEELHGRPMPARVGVWAVIKRVGYAIAGVAMVVVAIGGVIFVFDGPVSEIAAGTAAAGFFALAMGN